MAVIILVGVGAAWPVTAQDLTPTPTSQPAPTQTPWIILVTAEPLEDPPSLDELKEPPSLAVSIDEIQAERGDLQLEPITQVIDEWLPWMEKQQEGYLEMTGRYAQMLPSHFATPADGRSSIPDGWYRHPSDQQYSWQDLEAIRFEELPVSIRVDVYDGPEGIGYAACMRIQVGGQALEKCANHGPEALRNHDWAPVVEGEPDL
jgi:hypothetical protein